MTEAPTIRLGTRGSRLALAQTTMVAAALRAAHPGIEVATVVIQTTGDRILDSSLSTIGGKGVFTREIEQALLNGSIDVAVHSLKDLPTVQPEGLALGAVTAREDPRDMLLAREPLDWRTLGSGQSIGTSSLRRRAQIRRANREVAIEELRGNVPTRIRKMIEGEYTAIILAAAGIRRLGERAPYMQPLDGEDFLPAPAQGVVGLQVRADDASTRQVLAAIHDADAFACAAAERALLQGLGGGCQLPLGTWARRDGDRLELRGRILSLDGSLEAEGTDEGDAREPEAVGRRLAERLLAGNGRAILATLADSAGGFEDAVRRSEALRLRPLRGRTVLITRDEDADGPLSMAVRDLGGCPLCVPLLKHLPPEDPAPLAVAARAVADYAWLVFTSARGVESFVAALESCGASLHAIAPRVACVGSATASAIERQGIPVALVSPDGTGAGLVEAFTALGLEKGSRVLFPRADRAADTVRVGLTALGASVDDPVAYRTVAVSEDELVLGELAQGRVDAVLFASPSAVDAFAVRLDATLRDRLASLAVCSIGPTTTAALAHAGIPLGAEATERTFGGLARALADYWAAHEGAPANGGCTS